MALLMILDLSSPGGAGAVGYWGTWTLTLIVLALVGIAVGDEFAIAHPLVWVELRRK
jgi:hypothetical protein